MPDRMIMYGLCVVLLALTTQVRSISLTLDDDAQQLCNKYKMMCKSHDVCAVQHFTEPKMTMPVCIPLSFVPVRNIVCRLPPEKGSCNARYIRWHYNIHHQGCTHFQYGGCGGNKNNFMTKGECENACLRTPTIRLVDGGSIKPAVMTAPEYKPPTLNKYEALNSVMMSSPEYDSFERFQLMKQRANRNKSYSEVSTRKRRRLEKERAAKEKRRRERRKEKRRQRKLKKRQRRKEKKRGLKKKKKSGKKNKKKKSEQSPEITTEASPDKVNAEEAELDLAIVEKAEEIVNSEIETLEQEEEEERIKKEKRKERKRKKRRQRRKKRRLSGAKRHKKSKFAELRAPKESTMFKMFQILDKDSDEPQENSFVRKTN